MQYTLLGNTGLTVSRLAFGAMTFTAGNKDIGAVYKVGADLAGDLVADLETATALAPVYPNFFMDNIATDRALVEALGGRAPR